LLHKIATLNCEFSIIVEPSFTEDIVDVIKQLCISMDAIAFAQPHTEISKSDTQHFLDKNLNLILDTTGNCEIDDLKVL
jgi:hypothetical protein